MLGWAVTVKMVDVNESGKIARGVTIFRCSEAFRFYKKQASPRKL